MSRLVEFPLRDGGSVLVEVDDATPGATVTRGLGDRRVVEQASQTFEQAVARVQPAVQAMVDRLRQFSDLPDELNVEFGVQVSAEAGAFIAAVNSTGTFRVSMTWRLGPAQPEQEGSGGSS